MKLRPFEPGPVVIAARYNGPPGSANGGYTAGLVAARTPWPVPEVTLRLPPPLETPLLVVVDGDLARVTGPDGALVAEVRPGDVEAAVPAVDHPAAVAASARYAGLVNHPFPTCFVCGPGRPADDGLKIFPGRLPDGRTAAPFLVPDDVNPDIIWAALDCPGGWAVPQEGRPFVLGRCAVRIDALPTAGEACVVMGEMTGQDGRKAFARTTLYSAGGDVLAVSRSTWIAL